MTQYVKTKHCTIQTLNLRNTRRRQKRRQKHRHGHGHGRGRGHGHKHRQLKRVFDVDFVLLK